MGGAVSRIIQYIDYKGISKYKFYKETNLSNGFLDKNRNVGSDKCEIISMHYPDLNIEWVITGKGSMLKSNQEKENDVPFAKPTSKPGEGIPLIPASAMAGVCTGDISVTEIECERYVVPVFRDADFLIPVKGSSMLPKYSSGDIIACTKLPLNDLFFQWNKVYVLDTVQGPLVKRIAKGSSDDTVLLISENPTYKPFELPKNQLRAIALVIGVIRLE
jgi:phage repressor protein C with HTH and peptisase S24 domain